MFRTLNSYNQYVEIYIFISFYPPLQTLGQSDWETMNATMPSDVPNKISDLHVLAATNETLLIGWKRPHDNGAHISEYKMELRNVEESSVIGETMLIKDTAQETRNNYMYLFVGLEPAKKYLFQVIIE